MCSTDGFISNLISIVFFIVIVFFLGSISFAFVKNANVFDVMGNKDTFFIFAFTALLLYILSLFIMSYYYKKAATLGKDIKNELEKAGAELEKSS